MATLTIEGLSLYNAWGVPKIPRVEIPMLGNVLDDYWFFSGEFVSGKVSCLLGHVGDGGTALSYTLGGLLAFEQGAVRLDGRPLTGETLARIGTVLWFAAQPKRRPWVRLPTVREQIMRGLEAGNQFGITDIDEIIDMFALTRARLDRPLSQYSHERWRASAAIGFAFGKRIYAFPWLNPAYIRSHARKWLGHVLGSLRPYETWVLLPTADSSCLEDICDFDVIEMRGPFHDKELGS